MRFKGNKVKPFHYLSILEEAFKKACLEENQELAHKFAQSIEKNKKNGNNTLDAIKEAISFLSEG